LQSASGSRSSICHSQITGHESLRPRRIYMLARYYTSGSGRFLQVDPGYDYKTDDPMSFNLYGYVRGNPIMRTDPDGKFVFVAAILTLSAIDASLFVKVLVDSFNKGSKMNDKKNKGMQKLIDNGTEIGPDGPISQVVQKANKTVANCGKDMAKSALENVDPTTPDFGPGAKAANTIKATKGLWGWVKKAVKWVMKKRKATPKKKKALKINAGKEGGRPDVEGFGKLPKTKHTVDPKQQSAGLSMQAKNIC